MTLLWDKQEEFLIDKIKGRVRFGSGDSPVVNIEDVQKQLRGKDVLKQHLNFLIDDAQAYKNGTYISYRKTSRSLDRKN